MDVTIRRMRPSRLLFFGLIGLAVFALAGVLQAQDSGLGVEVDASAVLHDANNTQVGTVRLLDEEEYGTVAVLIQVNQLEPGFHGFYLYDGGECTAGADADAFQSAGQRWDQQDEGETQSLNGAFPPILVMQDGTGAMSFRTDRFQVSDLMDGDGSTVVVEAGTQGVFDSPTGDTTAQEPGLTGQRIACGRIEQGDAPTFMEGEMTDETMGEMTVTPGAEMTDEIMSEMTATPFLELTEETLVDVTLTPGAEMTDEAMGDMTATPAGAAADVQGFAVVALVDRIETSGQANAGPVIFTLQNQDNADRVCELYQGEATGTETTGTPLFTQNVPTGTAVQVEVDLEDGTYFVNCLRPDGTMDIATMGNLNVGAANAQGSG